MEIKKGIAASPGICIAKTILIDSEEYRIPRRTVRPPERSREIQRVHEAFHAAVDELTHLGTHAHSPAFDKIRDIFAVHLSFLKDTSLRKQIQDLIQNECVTAEYAVSHTLRAVADHFSSVPDPYISERAADIYDIERRVIRRLLGHQQEDLKHLREEVVVVARELSPTQTAGFNRRYVRGVAADAGGRTSHSAIVARSLGIPAVVALGDLTESVQAGQTVIIDGNRGIVIVDPDEATLAEYRRHCDEFIALEASLAAMRELPSVTRDGVPITLLGNIEFPHESEGVLERGGMGIGLYRTEFLYLNRETAPSEEEHYEAYVHTLKVLDGRPVTIRTVDLGADKYTQGQRHSPEPNPFLGLRSIRYCLRNLEMFKTQLRAILRASVSGKIRVMFPLITNLQELRQAKMILRDVMEDLDEEGIAYDRDIAVGIMMETPAAALTAATFASESDFFSIGTNDLTQYTLAVDRGNELVATLYSPAEPAVLRLIRTVVQDAYRAGIDVSVCGEMASEPEYVILLMGMGIRTFSMSPPLIPEIKKVVRSVDMAFCHRVTRKALTMNSERQITSHLRGIVRDIIPEAY